MLQVEAATQKTVKRKSYCLFSPCTVHSTVFLSSFQSLTALSCCSTKPHSHLQYERYQKRQSYMWLKSWSTTINED
uniref:Uncharacterized protein n=1 Tax=Anguilla anguilla TaxID=7936 RepID=A0A0E9X6A2_ANGAN